VLFERKPLSPDYEVAKYERAQITYAELSPAAKAIVDARRARQEAINERHRAEEAAKQAAREADETAAARIRAEVAAQPTLTPTEETLLSTQGLAGLQNLVRQLLVRASWKPDERREAADRSCHTSPCDRMQEASNRNQPETEASMTDTLPLGEDPRDAALPEGVVLHLSKLRRLDRTSYNVRLMVERANVDRQWQATQRVQANQQRRADRFIENAGVDDDDSMFDAATRERLQTLRRTDVMQWATEFGLARIAVAERKQPTP
jgi:hypothetical protein